MKLLSFLIGFITGYKLIPVIVKKLEEKNGLIEINSCEECPIYIEKDSDCMHFHYND